MSKERNENHQYIRISLIDKNGSVYKRINRIVKINMITYGLVSEDEIYIAYTWRPLGKYICTGVLEYNPKSTLVEVISYDDRTNNEIGC